MKITTIDLARLDHVHGGDGDKTQATLDRITGAIKDVAAAPPPRSMWMLMPSDFKR